MEAIASATSNPVAVLADLAEVRKRVLYGKL